MKVEVGKKGQVHLPREFREKLKIKVGDTLDISFDEESKQIVLSEATISQEAEIIFTDWGFPMIKTSGSFPEDFDTVAFIKEGYDEYFKSRFGT